MMNYNSKEHFISFFDELTIPEWFSHDYWPQSIIEKTDDGSRLADFLNHSWTIFKMILTISCPMVWFLYQLKSICQWLARIDLFNWEKQQFYMLHANMNLEFFQRISKNPFNLMKNSIMFSVNLSLVLLAHAVKMIYLRLLELFPMLDSLFPYRDIDLIWIISGENCILFVQFSLIIASIHMPPERRSMCKFSCSCLYGKKAYQTQFLYIFYPFFV